MQKHSEAILVVDDEESIRGLFTEILNAEGYSVLLASDGREACDLLRQGTTADVVVTDLVMPNQEGIETIRTIRHQYPGMKIVAMSGAFGGRFLTPAKVLGADATLVKPVQPKDLCAAIAGVLASN